MSILKWLLFLEYIIHMEYIRSDKRSAISNVGRILKNTWKLFSHFLPLVTLCDNEFSQFEIPNFRKLKQTNSVKFDQKVFTTHFEVLFSCSF